MKGNKRDTKFLIFQSLYIIAISILFYKGTDLSLTKVIDKNDDETVIEIKKLDSLLKLTSYDTAKAIVLLKLEDNARYQSVLLKDTVVTKELLINKDNRISELEKLKTPVNTRQAVQNKVDKNSHPATIEGETPK
ncbi:MAG: hypothetical protein ABI462_04225 [Ignavibacteria bacterium]